jgi:hypothetical protein
LKLLNRNNGPELAAFTPELGIQARLGRSTFVLYKRSASSKFAWSYADLVRKARQQSANASAKSPRMAVLEV